MIKRCRCANDYQDKRYGKGKRIHNPLGKDRTGRAGGFRCTVCTDTKVK